VTTLAVASGEVPFATSGHTGTPVRWWRTGHQLRLEARLVAAELGEIEQIVCFAPPQHLYGRLFGVVLPELLSVPVREAWHDPSSVPDWEPGLRTLFVCVPSSWLLLRRLRHRFTELPGAVALHGAGPVTDTARETLGSLPVLRAVEVFGATETGAVAVRELTPTTDRDTPWQLLEDVDATIGADGRLTVRGPRLARRDAAPQPLSAWTLDDIVRWVTPTRFVHLGRASRLIKVNGVRCDLGVVEDALTRAFPRAETVCVRGDDPVRGEHYDLFVAGDRVPATILSSAVTRALPGCPPPRAVHYVARIPRSATGKPRTAELLADGAVR
jgi:acyl-coenzyme A synthetase/AMP-(fatty) acid ligase